MKSNLPDLNHLSTSERDCLDRYVKTLIERIGSNLVEISLFGSVARGDFWPAHLQNRSDIDLLVLTGKSLETELREELVNQTYPLFLECGRQIAPQFWVAERFTMPETTLQHDFAATVRREGKLLYDSNAG